METIEIFLDLECTVNGGPNRDSPEAHWKNNKVLACGFQVEKWSSLVKTYPSTDELGTIICDLQSRGYIVKLIAHNAKFDIKYLMRDQPQVNWNAIEVHDTMTYEYRSSGHVDKFKSLEDTAAKYNIPFKKTLDLGQLLANGTKMEQIPQDTLMEYLIEDVKVLAEIYAHQKEDWNMDYILPLAEMELNGLTVNVPKAQHMMGALTNYINSIEDKLENHIMEKCQWQDGTDIVKEDFTPLLGTKSKCIKVGANRTLSFLLTGKPESLKITQKWVVQFKDKCGPMYSTWAGTPTHLGYPMGEKELEAANDWVSEAVLDHRGYTKLVSTYLAPFLESAAVQGTIHPKLNTTVTNTGRLSSSQPNGQNIPSVARELIIPSTPGAKILEIDFDQLEMVAAACVSGCPALLADLKAGVDVHQETADAANSDRKTAKGVNFGLLYGGGAKGLANSTGVDIRIVKKLIKAFYDRYPGVKEWQEEVLEAIKQGKYPDGFIDGEQIYASTYDEPFSGRRFTFVEQKAPAWQRAQTGRGYSFSPMAACNYPIQGFAGGDLVMFALTHLWRQLHGHVKFIMTVHDSILIESDDEELVEHSMELAAQRTASYFNLPAKLGFGITTGDNWS